MIGAGPAGLTAASELCDLGIPAEVIEREQFVGGLARTLEYKGYRFDLGGHRFFTKVSAIEELWQRWLGDDLLMRDRLSRIYFDGTFFDYPLKPANALMGLGPLEAARIMLSYARAQLFDTGPERTFEDWVSKRFGRRLFEIFFKTYTEKVWGMPCNEISSDWAVQRIKNLNLVTAVKQALLGNRRGADGVVTSLVERFAYPRHGPGMLWERCRDSLESRGCPVLLGSAVEQLVHADGSIRAATTRAAAGTSVERPVEHVISSAPLPELLATLEPAPPIEVAEAAGSLRYRDFLIVLLIVDRADLFPDQWLYIHDSSVRLARIQNFKNWSPAMVPDPSKSSLGLEYFVQENDDFWRLEDEELIEIGTRECSKIGLINADEVIEGTVARVRKAYPVYDEGYSKALKTIRAYLETFSNLQSIGRNGLHRYNNQDHSMLTGIYAAGNVSGSRRDVWFVNMEPEYHEEIARGSGVGGDRLTPEAVDPIADLELIASAFARYDSVALGGALAVVGCLLAFFMTVFALLAAPGAPIVAMLALIDNYLVGYRVSWPGALVGAAGGAVSGFLFGSAIAVLVNSLVGWHERAFLKRLELSSAQRLIDGEST